MLATLFGNELYVFGGYGGSGFARKDFNDLHVLDLKTFSWRIIESSPDSLPEPRSGHQGVSVKRKMYILGGWNSVEQFNNMYVFDVDSKIWTKHAVTSDFGPPRWNFAAVSVPAVPNTKVFIFGGNSGDLSENLQGSFLNDMMVLDTGSNYWSVPTVTGNSPPPRGETSIVYDTKQSRIIFFGGWANRWYGDLYVCKVAEVVGPPYAIESISPEMGPITGGTPCLIKGVGFKSAGTTASIAFACLKGTVEANGEVTDDNTISFNTRDFEKFGAITAEARVKVGRESLTNGTVQFSYFSVTSADTSLIFGPGCMNGCHAGSPVNVVIQAKDALASNRVCGTDIFSVSISHITIGKEKDAIESIPDTELHMSLLDHNDGTYLGTFTYPSAGLYELSVTFQGTHKGKAGHVRGSPFRVEVTPADRESTNNQLNGTLIMSSIQKQYKDTKDFANNSLKALKKPIDKEDGDALIKVKELLKDIESKRMVSLYAIIYISNMDNYFYY
jgi:dynein heavy chain